MHRHARGLSFLLTLFVTDLLIRPVAASADAAAAAHPLADNQIQAIIKTPISGFNRITVTIEVCAPGSTTKCQWIDNIMVDTGSTGLRIQRRAISPNLLGLPPLTTANDVPLAECEHFSGKYNNAWGSIRSADVGIGHMRASGLAIQIVNDESIRRPSWCKNRARATSNGTLGIGWRPHDPHAFVAVSGNQYTPLDPAIDANHLVNPVSKFAIHDNGEVFDFPTPHRGGEATLEGTITFGINTADNNQIKGADYLPLDADGLFMTTLDGSTFSTSYIDSGTPALILTDPALSTCEDVANYYDNSTKRHAAVLQEDNAAAALDATSAAAAPQPDPAVKVNFVLADHSLACRSTHSGVVGGFAEVSSTQGKFVWGLPFFLGRRVFLVQQQAKTDAAGKSVQRGQLYAVMPGTLP